MAEVLDNGDVAAQAPVHTAALVTHQHPPADGGPARVCRRGKPQSAEARSSAVRAGHLLRAHTSTLLTHFKYLEAGTAGTQVAEEEAELWRRRDFPKGLQQVTDSWAPSYTSLPVWGVRGWGEECVVPRAYSAGMSCSLSQGTRQLAQAFPREAGILWGM